MLRHGLKKMKSLGVLILHGEEERWLKGRRELEWEAQSNVSAVHAGRMQAASSALPAGHLLALEQLACAWGTCLPGHFTAVGEMTFFLFYKEPNLSLLIIYGLRTCSLNLSFYGSSTQ